MHEEVLKSIAEERRKSERRKRHLQDDLRYALKKLPTPPAADSSYEAVRLEDPLWVSIFPLTFRALQAIPLMEGLKEYQALEDEDRRVAFGKFIKRQKVCYI